MSARVPAPRPDEAPAAQQAVVTIRGTLTRTWHRGDVVQLETADGTRFQVPARAEGVTVDVLAPVDQPACTCGGQS